MKKLVKSVNNKLFDMSMGPFILMFLGIKLIGIIAIIALVIFTYKLIRKEYYKNIKKQEKDEKKDKEQ